MSFEQPSRRATSGRDAEATMTTATFRFLFDGLFFFCFDSPTAPTTCHVGILSTAPSHVLFLRVLKKSRDGSIETFPYALTNSSLRLIREVTFEFAGSTAAAHPRIVGEAFDRTNDNHDETDFRWVVDFEGRDLHNAALAENPDVLVPVMHFKAGEFSTAAAARSRAKYKKKRRGAESPYGRVARTIVAQVPVTVPGGRMDVTLRDVLTGSGRQFSVTAEAGVEYTLHLIYVRPEHLPEVIKQAGYTDDELSQRIHPHPHQENDIRLFYDLYNIPPLDRFDFVRDQTRGVDPYICYGVHGSQTTSLPTPSLLSSDEGSAPTAARAAKKGKSRTTKARKKP